MPRKLDEHIDENIANPLFSYYVTLFWEGTQYDTDPELKRRIEFPMIFHTHSTSLDTQTIIRQFPDYNFPGVTQYYVCNADYNEDIYIKCNSNMEYALYLLGDIELEDENGRRGCNILSTEQLMESHSTQLPIKLKIVQTRFLYTVNILPIKGYRGKYVKRNYWDVYEPLELEKGKQINIVLTKGLSFTEAKSLIAPEIHESVRVNDIVSISYNDGDKLKEVKRSVRIPDPTFQLFVRLKN